jgi:hypothetical protein
MGHRRTIIGSGECPSARHIVYLAGRPRVNRDAPGQTLHRSWMALCVTRLCRTYLSAVFPWETRKDVEALQSDRAAPRGSRWYSKARVWQEETLDTYVSLVWDPDCEEPWLLISDEGAGRRQVQVYAWRMRVEATFQDSKSRGWNIEASWIVDRTHLDRLLLALFLAMWWVSHLAAACIHHGQRHRFDRVDRRDKSIFRLGRLWLLDILRRVRNRASLRHCLPFQNTNTGWRFALRF